MTHPSEVELKLEVDPADRERLATARRLAGIAAGGECLVASYFDTPSRDIREAGYALRIRREKGKHLQTIKPLVSAAGLFERAEWEREVDDDVPVLDMASEPLAQALPSAVAGRLEPLFVTKFQRAARTLQHDGASFECAIDDGEICGGSHTLLLCEIELELETGSPRALFDFARRLGEEVPVRLSVISKAEHGYRLIEGTSEQPAKAEPIMLDPDAGVVDGFRTIAQSCVRQFRLNETVLLQTGAAEPLHQARVGLRRLRTALALHKPLFAGDERAALFAAELRWLAAELGTVRNLDVLAAQAGAGLRSQLDIVRARMLPPVHAELASARTRRLMIDLAEWLALGDWQVRLADTGLLRDNAVQFAGKVLDGRYKRLRHRGKHFATLDDAGRHKVRIAAKQLRYAAQFFASLYASGKAGRRLTAFLEAIGDLQDDLGALNDLATGARLLADLGLDAKMPGAGKRDRLLRHAEQAHGVLIDAKRFWR